MGTYTTNLNLYNTDMNTDGNDTFDFQRDLNDNNDKIDSAIGKLSNLTTEQQANLVSAINEIVSNLDGKTSKSLNDLNAVGQAILDKKVEVEALLAQNGYAKFSWKENNEISNLIINWCYVFESANPNDYKSWAHAMNKCYFACSNGGDYRYFSWIGNNYNDNMETQFVCGISNDVSAYGYVKCFAIGN